MFLFFPCLISVNELLKIKDELTKDRDEKLSEIAKVRISSLILVYKVTCIYSLAFQHHLCLLSFLLYTVPFLNFL